MDRRFVVPVEPASGDGETVVVEVLQTGARPLDIRLVACEGESPYVAKLQHRNLGKLKHKFKGSDAEWESILSHFLLQTQPDAAQAGLLKNVRMVYALRKDSVDISIRQDVKGIKVTLGEIILPKDEEFEFNPFEWAQASAQSHARTLQELADLKARASGEQDTVAKLKAQLDDFVKTKKEAEDRMLRQFMELLNDKKRKIRDQNRLLAAAKVDKTTAVTVEAAREERKPRKPTASRTSKRKAGTKAPQNEADADSEPQADVDAMEVDQVKEEVQDVESSAGAATPDRMSDETEDEGDAAPALTIRERMTGSPEPSRSQHEGRQPPQKDEDVGPAPSRRALPFARPATGAKSAASRAAPPPEDEDTDDDEL